MVNCLRFFFARFSPPPPPCAESHCLGLFHKWIRFDWFWMRIAHRTWFLCLITLRLWPTVLILKWSTTWCASNWQKEKLPPPHAIAAENYRIARTDVYEYDYNQIDNQHPSDWPLIDPCFYRLTVTCDHEMSECVHQHSMLANQDQHISCLVTIFLLYVQKIEIIISIICHVY